MAGKSVGVNLNKGEVVCIRWILNNPGFVNKQGAMTLIDIENSIEETRYAEGFESDAWSHEIPEKEISIMAIVWLMDVINRKFDATQVPGQLARPMLSLYDKCMKLKDEADAQ